MPLIRPVPLVGSVRVVAIEIVVVLPAPFGPSNPKISPCSSSRSIPSTATTRSFDSYTFVSFSISTIKKIHPAGKGGRSPSFRISHHARRATPLPVCCCINNRVPYLIGSHARENIGQTLSSALGGSQLFKGGSGSLSLVISLILFSKSCGCTGFWRHSK